MRLLYFCSIVYCTTKVMCRAAREKSYEIAGPCTVSKEGPLINVHGGVADFCLFHAEVDELYTIYNRRLLYNAAEFINTADQLCHQETGGHLLSIADSVEEKFLFDFLFPGNRQRKAQYRLLLGLFAPPFAQRKWTFTDGTNASYVMSRIRKPHSDHCVFMQRTLANWRPPKDELIVTSCKHEVSGLICKLIVPKVHVPTEPPEEASKATTESAVSKISTMSPEPSTLRATASGVTASGVTTSGTTASGVSPGLTTKKSPGGHDILRIGNIFEDSDTTQSAATTVNIITVADQYAQLKSYVKLGIIIGGILLAVGSLTVLCFMEPDFGQKYVNSKYVQYIRKSFRRRHAAERREAGH